MTVARVLHAVCIGLATLPVPAVAQTASDAVPTIDLTPMLSTIAPAAPTPDAAPVAPVAIPQFDRDAAVAATSAAAAATTLLPLQGSGSNRTVRISGETGTARFTLDLPDMALAQAFFLSYRASIDVLPERSQIRITVNGTAVPPVVPVSTDGFAKLPLPVNLLVKGTNTVDVAVTQAHRIFCGPQASFQIWSEFDLNASGVELAQGKLALNDAGFRTAMMAQAVGGSGIPLRGADTIAPAAMAEMATRLSGLGNGGGGWLRVENAYAPQTGAADVARISIITGDIPGVTLRQGAGGILVLAVVPASDGTLPKALDSYLPQPAPMADIIALTPGATATLAELGFPDTTDANHYIRHDVPFRLPEDWLILASQRASMTLLYSFAANLPQGSVLLVKVNQTTVQLLPLDRNGGKPLPPLAITFPARLLHPGPNDLMFEATVPGDPADQPCAPATGPFLTVLGTSDLMVPASPRMQLTDIGPTLLGLDQSGIAMPTAPDALTSEIGLSLLAELRPLAGQAILPDAKLSVVAVKSADQVPLEGMGLTLRDLATLLPEPAKTASAAVATPAPVPPAPVWGVTAMMDIARAIWDIARPGDPNLSEWLKGRTGTAVLLMPNTADPGKLWLVVGPSADPAQVAQAIADGRTNPGGPRGQLAVLAADGTWQSWQPASAVPLLIDPLSISNFRFVVGNYASWSPLYFMLLLAALTIVSVALALTFVVTTRGGRKR